ncbi:MAG: hypothetical protein ACO2YY_07550 [Pseudohongiellaceae bacterium]
MKKIAQKLLLIAISSPVLAQGCTMVIVFSQTSDWHLAPSDRNGYTGKSETFESLVDDDHWPAWPGR